MQVVLITGSARRVGAQIAKTCHERGMSVMLHYHHSEQAAFDLMAELNDKREGSAKVIKGDLLTDPEAIITLTLEAWGRLDALVNNAATFYPTPIGEMNMTQWEDLIGTNAKAPLFLSQAAYPELKRRRGCIVNIADIHGMKPLKGYCIYTMAKAALIMLTQSLATEMAPEVRVNAIAPGPVLWPEGVNRLDDSQQTAIVDKTLLKQEGSPMWVADAVTFLIHGAPYTTGHVLPVDGGRSVR